MTGTTTASLIALPVSEIQEMTGPTLVRVRGSIVAYSTAASPGTAVIAGGLIVLSESATTGALPGPGTDSDADWLYHEFYPSRPTVESTGTYWRSVIDNRAMRKLNEDDQIIFIIELCAGSGPVNALVGFAFLLKQV